MSRRAVGAATSAVAAFVFVLAMVLPWWKVTPVGGEGVRAHVTLVGGEVCGDESGRHCVDVSLTGRPGLRDDAFAWTGRLAFALLLAGVAAALVHAARPGPRSRLALAIVATGVAATGAAAVAIESLPRGLTPSQLGIGLWLALMATAMAAVAAADQEPGPRGSPGWRMGLAAAGAILVFVAWLTLATRSWWHQGFEFFTRSRSALGVEWCDGGRCTMRGDDGGPARGLVLLGLTAALAGALWVTTIGMVSRIARGRGAGAWGATTAIVAALVTAVATIALVSVPSRAATIGPGAYLFVAATIGLAVVSGLAHRQFAGIGPIVEASRDPVVAATPAVPGAVAPGARPILPSLGPQAVPVPAPPPPPPPPPMMAAYLPPLSAPPPAAAPLGPRPSPICPQCRGATLWHGKRAAWWCSTCKRAL